MVPIIYSFACVIIHSLFQVVFGSERAEPRRVIGKRRCPRRKPKEVNFVLYLPREEGQGLVEYALILVMVAIVVVAILALLGPQIANIFSQLTSQIP